MDDGMVRWTDGWNIWKMNDGQWDGWMEGRIMECLMEEWGWDGWKKNGWRVGCLDGWMDG